MPILAISISLVTLVGCYLLVSIKDRSFINVLTPAFIIFIPSNYILEYFHLSAFGESGSAFGYFFIYASYSAYFIGVTLAYLFFPRPKRLIQKNFDHSPSSLLPYILLILGALLFVPILLEFRDILTNPREIYTSTRTGHGISFFLSTTFAYLAFILFLYKRNVILPLAACTFFILMHGSKGQLLTLFLILILFKVYVEKKKFKLVKTGFYMGSLSLLIFASFFIITFKGVDLSSSVEMISNYADTTRNALLVVDNFDDFKYGKLTLEENIYPRIPRAIYPDKPKDFGMFYLAKEFFPEWFEADTGSPYFGILGLPFADFGYLAIFYLLVWGLFIGWFLNIFKARAEINKSPFDFIMLCFFAGISLVPVGAGFLLIDHLLIAWVITFFFERKYLFLFKPSRLAHH